MRDDLGDQNRSYKANVCRPGGGLVCYQSTLASSLLQINLLRAEGQSFPAFAKGNNLHAQHFRVELTGCINIFNCKNHVVDAVDFHDSPPAIARHPNHPHEPLPLARILLRARLNLQPNLRMRLRTSPGLPLKTCGNDGLREIQPTED